MCNMQTRDDKAKQPKEVVQSETKMSEETFPVIEDSQQESQQSMQQTQDPPQPRVLFSTQVHAHS